jgi:putative chitinase
MKNVLFLLICMANFASAQIFPTSKSNYSESKVYVDIPVYFQNRLVNISKDGGVPSSELIINQEELTGKNNYIAFADSLEITPEEASEYLATFEGAAQSACWFWESNNLNQWADKGDILTLTKRINGGTIGLEDRIKHYEHALHVLGV